MKLIVAVDKNWGIGNNGNLLAHIPLDMKHFKEKTMNNLVVMGRKTLESFPGKKPLINRTNLVLTRNTSYSANGVEIFHSIEELRERIVGHDNVFIIGGGEIYREFLPYCDEAIVTYIHEKFDADTFFPNLDENPNWYLENESTIFHDNPYSFTFRTYKRAAI